MFDCLSMEVSQNVTDFRATLNRAEATDNTLELADGTSFLGEAIMGSKPFIRPCYEIFSELVLDGASSGNLQKFGCDGYSRYRPVDVWSTLYSVTASL